MITQVRNAIADYVWVHSVRRHRSRLGWRLAPKYTNYLERARRSFRFVAKDPELAESATQFRKNGWAAFSRPQTRDLAKSMYEKIRAEEAQGLAVWDEFGRYAIEDIYKKFPEVEALLKGDVGEFLRATYGTNFKAFSGVCYKSAYDPKGPSGSQLWHADGGPGTCINLMWCLSPVSAENGAMECLPWDVSVSLFQRERRHVRPKMLALSADPKLNTSERRRLILCDYYREEIAKRFSDRIVQPHGNSGLVFAFTNNILHKGGYPQPGQERYVCVFHFYPSVAPAPLDEYRESGIQRRGSFPADPAFDEQSSNDLPKFSLLRLFAQTLRRSEPLPGDRGWLRSIVGRRGVFDIVSTIMQLRDLRRVQKVQNFKKYNHPHYDHVHTYNAGVTSSKIITRTRRAERLIPALAMPPRDLTKERVLLVGPRNVQELLQVWLTGFSWENIEAVDLYSTNQKIKVMNMEEMQFPDSSFDALLASATLGYAKDVERAVREFMRVLKPGGRAAFTHSHVHTETTFPGNALTGDDVARHIERAGGEIYYKHTLAKTIRTGQSADIHFFGVVRRT